MRRIRERDARVKLYLAMAWLQRVTVCHKFLFNSMYDCYPCRMDDQAFLPRPQVFDYDDPNKFFRDFFRYQKSKNPRFTTRAMARSLSLKSHSLISHFIAGTRKIKPHHLDKITTRFNFSDDELRYFEAVIFRSNAKSGREREFYDSVLARIKPGTSQKKLTFDEFKLVAHWVHMAILEMTELRDFKPDPKWIQSRLFFPAPLPEIAEACERLVSAGLLEEKNGTLVKAQKDLTTDGAGKNAAIRTHHKQILELAKQATDEQATQERFLNSSAITVSLDKLPGVHALIGEFRERITRYAESTQGDETYELSIQFFKLTKKEQK